MLVRLLTENKNYPEVCKIVSGYFDGFTVIKADGYWHGNAEHSLVIEIDSFKPGRPDHCINARVEQAAYEIKKLNKQDKILVQYIQAESKLL